MYGMFRIDSYLLCLAENDICVRVVHGVFFKVLLQRVPERFVNGFVYLLFQTFRKNNKTICFYLY
jgi:hypothetical protein